MCGIVALYSNENPIAQDALTRATERLIHRGPDGQGYWIAPHGSIGLGHTRLSVIDLSGGAQPISNEDERFRIVVNGEFYDFESIRSGLERAGHQFRTRTDSEIALHLYEDVGPKCLDHLRGEFAFVVWDETNRTLFAARDRFGIKPLFYSQQNGTLYIASEISALFAAGVQPAWNPEGVYQALLLCPDQQQSLFSGIRQVPAGHYLLAKGKSIQVVRYWDLDYPRSDTQAPEKRDEEWIEQLGYLLDEAVRIRMRADVPVGCYLSGGIDSASVLSAASRHVRERMTAFTIAFDHPDFDESDVADRHSKHVGADFHRIRVTQSDLANAFVHVVGHGEMIHYNAHGVARWLLSRAVRQAGYKVVLAGEGADELFAGYDFLQPALHNSTGQDSIPVWMRLFRLLRPKTPGERAVGQISPWLFRTCRMLGIEAGVIETLSQNFGMLRSVAAHDFLQSFQGRDIYSEFMRRLNFRAQLAGRETVKQLLYIWMKSLFVSYVLAAERLDMAHAVEVRLPFLDHKLFEFARSMPVSLLRRYGIRKYPLREAVRYSVTDEVYRGSKHAFFAPPATVCPRNPLFELLQDLVRDQAFSSVPFFNRASVTGILDRLPKMDDQSRASIDPLLFALASITVLHARFKL